MARRPTDALVSVACSPDELQILAELRAAGGFTSDANAIRSALWSLADHYEIAMPNGVFDQRDRPRLARVRGGFVKMPTRSVKQISQRAIPPKNHPWRNLPKSEAKS